MASKHFTKIIQRMAKGKTQIEIAKELGISQPAVSQALSRVKYCPHCKKPLYEIDA